MKILYLCGVFAKENEWEVVQAARKPVEYSANLFQEKMIRAFRQQYGADFEVLSAPFLGAYPNASSWFAFNGFSDAQPEYRYVHFLNVWGIRNISRTWALKRAVRDFVRLDEEEKLIVVYSPHTPFLEAAAFAKKLDPRIRICLVIPDLPQYMNLDAKVSAAYKIAKKADIRRFNSLAVQADSFMLLTEAMKEKIPVFGKPCIVVEGIVEADIFDRNQRDKALLQKESGKKYVVYTGKMQEKFGVRNLLDAFLQLPDPDSRLILCGTGELDEYIHKCAREDNRVLAMGQVSPETAREWVLKADVLVNPRQNNEEYTKYSFPSKNMEYLASGAPVVAYMLDGMKPIYRDFICQPEDDSVPALAAAIRKCLCSGSRPGAFREYAQKLTAPEVVKRLMKMNYDKED